MSLFDIFIGKSIMKSPFFHRSIHRCFAASRLHRHVAVAVHGEGDQRSPGAAQGSQGVAGWEDSQKKAPKG